MIFIETLSCNILVTFESGKLKRLLFPRSITFSVLREGHEVVLPHGFSGVARTHPRVTVVQMVLLPLILTAGFQCIEEVSGEKKNIQIYCSKYVSRLKISIMSCHKYL